MIPKTCERSKIFSEFSAEEAAKHFSLTRAKVLPHIDNFYYNVYVQGDSNDESHEMSNLLQALSEAKNEKKSAYDKDVEIFGLDMYPSNYSIYEFRLSCRESYDIFIANYLPNDQTPRIQVQLRSRMLVLRGVTNAILESYEKVREILATYGLVVFRTVENRIDYAYHTNLIQKPMNFFDDEHLMQHLVSLFRKGQKVFYIKDEIDLTYFSLGFRTSNNLFFRVYDKSREVCEKAYKGFFLERWRSHGLISQYDFECYSVAYEKKSFEVGLLLGRIEWYLKHGHDDELKTELFLLRDTCYVKNCNSDQIRKKLKGVLPEVTVIVNAEYETKRKFYLTLQKYIENLDIELELPSPAQGYGPTYMPAAYTGEVPHTVPVELDRLFKVLSLRQVAHDYMTSEVVSFHHDRRNVDRKNLKESMQDFWYRIHTCKVDHCLDMDPLRRDYSGRPEIERARQQFLSSAASLSMKLRESVEEASFEEDMSDILSNLNDNSFYGFNHPLSDPLKYVQTRRRLAFRNRHVVDQLQRDSARKREQYEKEHQTIEDFSKRQEEKK